MSSSYRRLVVLCVYTVHVGATLGMNLRRELTNVAVYLLKSSSIRRPSSDELAGIFRDCSILFFQRERERGVCVGGGGGFLI
jgi:hypothetical protein